MQQIPLNNTQPNQQFEIMINGNTFEIGLRTVSEITYITVSVNGTKLVDGARCPPNVNLLNYSYLQTYGDFKFTSEDDEYPYYENFGKKCRLYFIPIEEL